MKQKHIDCLDRLMKLTGCYYDIIEFLQLEKLITSEELTELTLEVNKQKYLCSLLFKAKNEEKIQLLAFDWIVLPEERIRIRIITDNQTKEFSHHF